MPRKASGLPKTKRVERLQKNGDTYIYEVVTLYNDCVAKSRLKIGSGPIVPVP